MIKLLQGAFAALFVLLMGNAQATLSSGQSLWMYYNVAGTRAMGDVFSFQQKMQLQSIEFAVTGGSLSFNVPQPSVHGTLYLAPFSILGTTPAELMTSSIWSAGFDALTSGSAITNLKITPNLWLDAGAYTLFAIPTIIGWDASGAGIDFVSAYSDESNYQFTWNSFSQKAYQEGLHFDGPTSLNDSRQSSFDLTIATVPEPEIYVLLLTAIGLLGFSRYRMKNATVSFQQDVVVS